MPNVNWNGDKLNVNWTNPDNRNDNLRARAEVSMIGLARVLFVYPRYLSQPFVIFDISCRFCSSARYDSFLMIKRSCSIRIMRLRISILIRSARSVFGFSSLVWRDAVIASSSKSRQSVSILRWIPKWSRFWIRLPN